jgi:predicted GIY-YIG superfamily endonuclease
MTVTQANEAFDAVGVRMSPDLPGVYVLFHGERTIYIGTTDRSIRRALQSHEEGERGTLTRHATTFWCEPTGGTDNRARAVELLDAYKTVHNMNVPAGNRPQRAVMSARQGALR